MKSVPRGKCTSAAEVTNVSANGFWLLLDGTELFVEFRLFPWFRDASIGQITNVERPSAHHLHWPELDVDLAVDSLTDPARYPLVSRIASAAVVREPARRAKRRRS
jgi:hypothetical protein